MNSTGIMRSAETPQATPRMTLSKDRDMSSTQTILMQLQALKKSFGKKASKLSEKLSSQPNTSNSNQFESREAADNANGKELSSRFVESNTNARLSTQSPQISGSTYLA